MKLCKGAAYSYKDCPIHRIVKDGWFQSGDVIDGSGANSVAVLDTTGIVPDESFSVDFSLATGGIVGYANSRPHSNGSQFFVTLGPCGWMNNKFVGIGRVLQGFSTLRSMNVVPVENQSPSLEIVVDACGVEIAKSK